MWQNLYQKTIYEIYKSREHLGYKIFDFDEMFVVLWNNQQMSYFNMVHCHKFGPWEFNLIKQNFPDTFLSVASAQVVTENLSILKQGTPSYLMMCDVQNSLAEDDRFEILRVTDERTVADFCDVVTEVYDRKQDKDALMRGFLQELDLDNCFRYVGYINHQPAGTVELAEGKEAVCVSWGAVKNEFRKRGLYRTMLVHAIHKEADRGLKTIVLNSSEMGRDIYTTMGFVPLAPRYNYVLDRG